MRWADLGDAGHGFSLLNASKYGYDAIGNVLRLSLLRSPVYPDPTADRGRHEFRYSLYPHAGTWQQAQTVRRGYELNYTLSAVQVEAHAGSLPPVHSFVTVQGDNVVLTAIKKAEDSNALILRLYEWAGKTAPLVLNLPGTPISAEEVGMMETDVKEPQSLHGSSVTTTSKPFEIKTLRIDYGNTNLDVWQGKH